MKEGKRPVPQYNATAIPQPRETRKIRQRRLFSSEKLETITRQMALQPSVKNKRKPPQCMPQVYHIAFKSVCVSEKCVAHFLPSVTTDQVRMAANPRPSSRLFQ